MAANPIPQNPDELFAFGEDMADGLNQHEGAIGMAQNLEAGVRADLLAAQTAEAAYQTGRATKISLGATTKTADAAAKVFIRKTRGVLQNYLGTQWATEWEPTGFPNQSIGVPSTRAERQTLLSSLSTYLTNNAGHENAGLNVTAAEAGALFTALSDARSALNNHIATMGQQRSARNEAVNALRVRLRGTINELTQLLEDDAPLFYAFGLNPPGAPDTPEQPEDLVLTPGAPGIIYADWNDAPRADHYKVYKQEVGVDADFVLADSPSDSDATLTGQPSGQTVKLNIVAVNDAGDSPVSGTEEIVVP